MPEKEASALQIFNSASFQEAFPRTFLEGGGCTIAATEDRAITFAQLILDQSSDMYNAIYKVQFTDT